MRIQNKTIKIPDYRIYPGKRMKELFGDMNEEIIEKGIYWPWKMFALK